jgi:hypothetical protein
MRLQFDTIVAGTKKTVLKATNIGNKVK